MAEHVVSVSSVVNASPETVFDVLADPARHGEIDGSGMVQRVRGESQQLERGSTFGMDMKFGGFLPYRITNEVMEVEEHKLIARQHQVTYPKKHPTNMEATLERLASRVES